MARNRPKTLSTTIFISDFFYIYIYLYLIIIDFLQSIMKTAAYFFCSI